MIALMTRFIGVSLHSRVAKQNGYVPESLLYKSHQHLNVNCSSRLEVVFVHYVEAKCSVENEDVVVVGTAPTKMLLIIET